MASAGAFSERRAAAVARSGPGPASEQSSRRGILVREGDLAELLLLGEHVAAALVDGDHPLHVIRQVLPCLSLRT